jgi:hypothetical protein
LHFVLLCERDQKTTERKNRLARSKADKRSPKRRNLIQKCPAPERVSGETISSEILGKEVSIVDMDTHLALSRLHDPRESESSARFTRVLHKQSPDGAPALTSRVESPLERSRRKAISRTKSLSRFIPRQSVM